MAKDRIQVPDLYKDRGFSPGIQPTASPVDTFVSPAQPVQDRRLLELAAAWSQVQPGLTQFAQERIEHSNKQDVEKGRAAALENKAQFAQAVKDGKIPAGANPWFKVGYERQKATRTSLEYDQALREAYAQTNLVDSDNPAEVSRWMAEFTQKWIEDHPDARANPEFSRTFQMMGARSQDQLQTLHAAQRTQKIEQEAIQDTDFMLGAVLDRSYDLLGNTNPDLGSELATIVSEQVANGLAGPMANKLVADAVIRKAVAEGDVTILDVLDQVPSGSGTVGQVGYVKSAVAQARDQITSERAQRDRLNKLSRDEQRKTQINETRGEAYRMIAQNPYADVSAQFDKLSRIDPDEAAKLETFRTSFLSSLSAQNKVIENNVVKTDYVLRAIRGTLTESQVEDAVSNNEIDAETAKDLLVNLIPKATEQKTALSNPVINRISGGLKKVIIGNEASASFKDERYALAEQADEMFLRGMLDFSAAKPTATTREILEEATKLRDAILGVPEFRPDAEPLPDARPALEKTQAENKGIEIGPDIPQTRLIFKSEDELKAAIAEAAQTGGASGRLKELADLYKTTPLDLMNAQRALLQKKPKK